MSAGFTVTRAKITGPRRTKYNSTPTVVDGIRFHSKKEANRYVELNLLQRKRIISDLILQPAFSLYVPIINGSGNKQIALYKADFDYGDVEHNQR